MEAKELGIGTKILAIFALTIAIGGLVLKCKNSFTEENSGKTENLLSCGLMEKWTDDEDIIKSLQGIWIMENEDYYGKYKIEFNGNTATTWKMDAGGNEWKSADNIQLREIKKYTDVTKMNQGPEYYITYDTSVGSMSFDINCISGLTIASNRYPEYGISFIKQ